MTGDKRKRAEAGGRKAERLAAWFLRFKGYRILETRFRSRAGEIDLIARRGHHIAIIEVKARKDRTSALEAITPHQRRRIERAAADWLSRRQGADFSLRFDVIAIVSGRFPVHIRDAWRPES